MGKGTSSPRQHPRKGPDDKNQTGASRVTATYGRLANKEEHSQQKLCTQTREGKALPNRQLENIEDRVLWELSCHRVVALPYIVLRYAVCSYHCCSVAINISNV